MTIQQTVDIPVSRRLIIEVPREIPAGRAILAFTPVPAGDETLPDEARGQSGNEAFRRALRRAYGAWADKPWKNASEDINAMRDEWDHRDPWNTDPSKRHRD
ncbi:MAG: hypothetical protein LBF83_08395 [Spirochaetaceae bacterium]|jgi:hypothetical protein|nr:hypothetical protein [Spirochaetaceae bacterium]